MGHTDKALGKGREIKVLIWYLKHRAGWDHLKKEHSEKRKKNLSTFQYLESNERRRASKWGQEMPIEAIGNPDKCGPIDWREERVSQRKGWLTMSNDAKRWSQIKIGKDLIEMTGWRPQVMSIQWSWGDRSYDGVDWGVNSNCCSLGRWKNPRLPSSTRWNYKQVNKNMYLDLKEEGEIISFQILKTN